MHTDSEVEVVSLLALLSLRRRDILDAKDLYARRVDLFPFLDFAPGVEANLNKLQRPAFQQVVHYLSQMDDAVSIWNPEFVPAPEDPPHTTNESQTRKVLCYFPNVSGGRGLFTWHGRYIPGAGRIHFRLEFDPKKVVVGYIDKKDRRISSTLMSLALSSSSQRNEYGQFPFRGYQRLHITLFFGNVTDF